MSRRSWWQRLSLQDLMALYAPELILVGILAVIAAMVYDPTMKMLLYTALPDGMRTPIWFILCFAEELRNLMFEGAILVPVLQIHVLTFEVVDEALRSIAVSVRNR